MQPTESSSSFPRSAPDPLRPNFPSAARFWEPRRGVYNLILIVVALTWLISTWPHFRPALNLIPLLKLSVLALLANLCYCAAYVVDLPLLASSFVERWMRWRWSLWLVGTIFAVLLEWYWIGDEIYPDFR